MGTWQIETTVIGLLIKFMFSLRFYCQNHKKTEFITPKTIELEHHFNYSLTSNGMASEINKLYEIPNFDEGKYISPH